MAISILVHCHGSYWSNVQVGPISVFIVLTRRILGYLGVHGRYAISVLRRLARYYFVLFAIYIGPYYFWLFLCETTIRLKRLGVISWVYF